MRILSIIGWTCLAIYSIVVAGSFYSARNATGEQKMGLIIPMMMIPPIIVFTIALGFAQYRASTVGTSIIALLLTLPILFFGPMIGGQILTAYLSSRSQELRGSFQDPHLADLGSAIKANDPQKLRSLLKHNSKVDWNARDRSGFTLLGSAVKEVKLASSQRGLAEQCVSALVDAGAPFQDDAMGPNTKLLSDIVTGSDAELLELVIKAGADPNAKDNYGNPALIGVFMEANKAKILLDAGAELSTLRSSEKQFKDYDALMYATVRARWDLALLYLERGCDPDYQTPNGDSARSIAERQDPDVNRAKGNANRDGFLRVLAATSKSRN